MPRRRAAAAPRRPGRPPRDDGRLRGALLDAALEAFAARGIHATTMAAVARAAGATPALVHYYFGDREGLLQAVLEERLRGPVQQTARVLRDRRQPDPLLRLRAFALAYAGTVAAHPWIPRLVVREVLTEGGALREQFGERFARVVAAEVVAAIGSAQQAGRLRRDLPPEALALGLMSLIVFPFVAAPVVVPALGVAVGAAHASALAERQWTLFCQGAEPPHDP